MTDNYLKTIDNNEKAYCLGFFSYINDMHTKYSKNCYELTNIDIKTDDKLLRYFENIVDIMYDDLSCSISMNIINANTLDYIKTNINNFDNFSDKYKCEFIRGVYEYNYLSNDNNETNDILIKKAGFLDETKVIEKIADYLNVPYIYTAENEETYYQVKYGCSTVDFLGLIYNNINNECSVNYCNYNTTIPRCGVIKTDENAVIPSKKNWSDAGFDLSIIKKLEDFNTKTSLYDTGIKIQLDFGYYAEIVPRSSMSKTGYILANSIGIIDNSYRGNLMIALTKIADDAIEIKYPFKCCQLIIKKQVNINLEEVSSVDATKRNIGGFGSTG
jgi:deoxyuridine 5'-triphosphate nucleotidohydrolase